MSKYTEHAEPDTSKPKGMEVGPPLYVDSLMTEKEIQYYSKIHHKTYCPSCNKPGAVSKETFRWRVCTLTADERVAINANIEYLLIHNKVKEIV